MSSAASWRGRDRRVMVVPPMQSFPRRRTRLAWWRIGAMTAAFLLCAAAWIGAAASMAPHLRGPL